MLVLGVDPSSSCFGFGYAEAMKVVECGYHECDAPADRNDRATTARNMVRFHHHLRRGPVPDLVIVEEVSVTMGMHTVRMLAYSEAVPIMYAAEVGAELMMVKATSVRRVLWGRGGLSKAGALELMVASYPDLPWPLVPEDTRSKSLVPGTIDPDGPGGDMSDGCQLAMAGELLRNERMGT